MSRVATVSADELLAFFQGKRGGNQDDRWTSEVNSDGEFWAHSNAYTVFASPKGIVYSVDISAVDDRSDSASKVTDDPIEFIVEFLETGSEADGFFRARASVTPDAMSGLLRKLASGVESGEIGPRRLSSSIRRAVAAVDAATTPTARSAAVKEEGVERELSKLQNETKSKGWKSRVDRTSTGTPALTIDIGGQYTARVMIDHVVWDYAFKVTGVPGLEDTVNEEGVTHDPIASYRKWRNLPEVQEARAEAIKKAQPAAPEDDWDFDNAKTGVPSTPKPGGDKTVAPPSKADERTVNPRTRNLQT